LGDGPRQATLVASLTAPPSEADFAVLPPEVEWLEVRADLAGDLDPAALRQATGRKLLYTLRSAAEGGASEASPARRHQRLAAAAAAGFDLIDLEGERDLAPALLDAVPPARRLLSWHGPASDVAGLKGRFGKLAETPARLYKLIPAAQQPGEDLAPLALLHALGRPDVVAFASGPAGLWTRLVAPRLGAPFVYGSLGARPAAPGQPAVTRLVADFGLPPLPPADRLFGIVGSPVAESLSPRLHNAAYRALGIPAVYLPFETEAFGVFWLEVVEATALEALGLPLVGLSVTTPFKEAALSVAGAASPRAEAIGAANTLVRRGGVWEAESTDPEGVLGALAARGIDAAGRVAVVVGPGGAGRAAVAGLRRRGARVTLSGRSAERGGRAAARLRVPFIPSERLDPSAFDLLVNATPLGRQAEDPLPFPVDSLAAGAVVVDLVYRREPTALVRQARLRGLLALDGREVLLHQAIPQFRLMTGLELPVELGRRVLELPSDAAPGEEPLGLTPPKPTASTVAAVGLP
jgi:3-dehydroquinate dehydratase/shikimate dehydrogenase